MTSGVLKISSTLTLLFYVALAGLSYSFGFFESNVDLITSSITHELWMDQGSFLLWNATEFLLPDAYGIINDLIPGINAFSIAMSMINAAALTLITLGLIRISTSLPGHERMALIAILSLILIVPHILTVNSTRIAVLGTYGVLLTMLWTDSWHGKSGRIKWVALITLLIVLVLVRMEAVIIVGLVAGIPLFFFSNRSVRFLAPVILGLITITAYNLALNKWGPDEMKAFYYYENELIDRGNVCVEDAYRRNLMTENAELDDRNDSLSLQTTALLHHGLFDEGTVQPEFLAEVVCSTEQSGVLNWVFGGIGIESWRKCLLASFEESKRGWWALVGAIGSLLLLVLVRGVTRETVCAAATLTLPVLLALHITIPLRFAVPFFTCFSVLCALGAVLYKPKLSKYVAAAGFLLVICATWVEYEWLGERMQRENRIEQRLNKLRSIVTQQNRYVILQSGSPHKFLPQRLSSPSPKMDSVLFMDEYFTYQQFYEDWNHHCDCDSESIAERLNFAVASDAAYISTDDGVDFIMKYASMMHSLELHFEPCMEFGKHMKVYKLSYDDT
jgi:hypothetical protein